MKRFALALAAAAGLAFVSNASATTGLPWFDSFENPSATAGSYQPWTGSGQSTLAVEANHPHTGTNAARAFDTTQGGWSDSYTMGNTTAGVTGGIETDVWLWDDNSVSNTSSTPVNAMLAFVGANGTSTPGFGTDYAELGIISGNTASLNDYVIRVRSYDQAHTTTWFDTGVARTQGFTHLEIVADPNPSDGGDGLYHFFINGNEVGPGGLSRNTSAGLQWDRIGSNSGSFQNFWYDDFNIQATPEPASMALLGMGALGLLARRRRQA